MYIAIQRSVAEYAAAAWTPWLWSSNIEKLERTQLQAARAITHHVRSTPTEAVLYEADLPRLKHRFKTLCVLQANKCNSLEFKDPRRVVLNDSVRLRLRRPDWRTTVLAALSSLGLLTNNPGDHSPPRPDPPWSRPPPAPTRIDHEYEDWQSALVLCDSKSLVETLANSNQPDGDVHRIHSAIAELCKKKEVRILWVPGQCNLRGNELVDLEAKLSSEVAQPSIQLDSSTRAALIRREERQSSLTHPRLTALYTTRPREEEKALLQKADRTALIRFRCGHHLHRRRWQHMTGMSETDSCRFCQRKKNRLKI